ncbi:unnamed protein product, partial [Vitis vinifera]|uniref:Uncharacterized protein n=1 Tax=Vitis vinifera TaxID=29760 RepID=D7T1X8_VITVI
MKGSFWLKTKVRRIHLHGGIRKTYQGIVGFCFMKKLLQCTLSMKYFCPAPLGFYRLNSLFIYHICYCLRIWNLCIKPTNAKY